MKCFWPNLREYPGIFRRAEEKLETFPLGYPGFEPKSEITSSRA